MIGAVLQRDDGVPVMTQRQKMHTHVQIEVDLPVVGQVREIIVYQLQGRIKSNIETHSKVISVLFDGLERYHILFVTMAKFNK